MARSSTAAGATAKTGQPSAPGPIKSDPLQLDLLNPNDPLLTKSIGLWDLVPWQVYYTPAELRRGEFLKSIVREFSVGGRRFKLTLRPARVEKDGKEIEEYPGDREHLIELAIRKLAISNGGLHMAQLAGKEKVGIEIAVYDLYVELERNGHTSSYQQITHALNILRGASYEITRVDSDEDGHEVETGMSGNIFDNMKFQRNRNPDKQQRDRVIIQVNPLIAEAIMGLDFYDVSYQTLMSLKRPVARWIFKRLQHDTVFNMSDDPRVHTLSASAIQAGSGMGEYARPRDLFTRVAACLKDLTTEGINASVEEESVIQGEGRRKSCVDINYRITVSESFYQEATQSRRARETVLEDYSAVTNGMDPHAGWHRAGEPARAELAKRRSTRRATKALPLLEGV